MEKACDSWKIDPKDYKICRNCKKTKKEHQTNTDILKSKSVENNNFKAETIVVKENLLTSNTTKEGGEKNEKKLEYENQSVFQEKKALFQNLAWLQKNKNFKANEMNLTITKQKDVEKKKVQDLTSSSSSDESESKKESEPITKNLNFKNKLEGIFAKGNPMRMNDDLNFPPLKKNNLNILANGKRASRTYGGFSKICFHLI